MKELFKRKNGDTVPNPKNAEKDALDTVADNAMRRFETALKDLDAVLKKPVKGPQK